MELSAAEMDNEREKFEAWSLRVWLAGYSFKRDGKGYADREMNAAWCGWLARARVHYFLIRNSLAW